jgi:eukaryotic-like serine/threonine-protein kinase
MSGRQPRNPSSETASIATCSQCGGNLMPGDRFCGSCGSAAPEVGETELLMELQQATLGDLDIKGILGRGGMGLVFLAHDISLNRKVALKVLPPDTLQGDAAVERFRREARIAAALRHRNITSVYGLKETTKLVFFVMEYVEGRTLDAVLRDEGRLPIDVVRAVINDTASALSYAHRREVVHRDLKPGNLIVDGEGMVMVTDFGVAKLTSARGLTQTGSTVGSPKYMSPEQWSGNATGQSDQYALGCVAYELLTGRTPFEGETIAELMKQQLFDPPRPVSELRPDTPPALAEGVMRMLRKDPTERWPSLDGALQAMEIGAVSAEAPVRDSLAKLAKRGHDVRALPKTPRTPIPASTVRLKKAPAPGAATAGKGRLLWAGVAVVVLVLGIGGYLMLRPRGSSSTPPAVESIDFAGAPAQLGVGERAQLNAQLRNAAGVVVSGPIAWSSSDTTVARVSSDGVITAVAAGTVTVQAASAGKNAGLEITIVPKGPSVATVEIVPHGVSLAPGGTQQLQALPKDAQGHLVTGGRIDWASNDPAVLTVSARGVATGVAAGTASVTATAGGASVTVPVTVASGAVVASIDVSPARVPLAVRRTFALRATARDARGNILRRVRVAWQSSNPAVAAVGANGVVSALSPGTATVTAQSGGVTSAPAEVTVSGASASRPPPRAAPGLPGILQMLVAPAWANVTIDGVPRGQRTRGVDTLSSGVAHRVHFERPGFASVDTTVTLGPGEQLLLRILMTKQ